MLRSAAAFGQDCAKIALDSLTQSVAVRFQSLMMGSEMRQLHHYQILLADSILPFVDCMMKEGRKAMGLMMGVPEIKDINTSSSSLEKEANCDRFKLEIPYAGVTLTWEILFDCHHPSYPPDIIFKSEDNDFDVDVSKLQSLINWNMKNPACLVALIHELLDQYKDYQRSLVNQHQRLCLEYTYLVEQDNYSHQSVEVHVTKRTQNKFGPVNFLIRLPVRFSELPCQLMKENPDEDSAHLLVSFTSPESGKVTPQLYLSSRLESILGGTSQLRLPSYHQAGGLIEYVPNVCSLLEKKIDQVCDGFNRRKEYIAAFLSHFGRSVLEYDQDGFSRICLLQEWNDFFFVVHVELPLMFPVDKPLLTFQSIYHESEGNRPYQALVRDYPYSPRWTGNEMAERAWAFFLDYIPTFQKASLSGGSL